MLQNRISVTPHLDIWLFVLPNQHGEMRIRFKDPAFVTIKDDFFFKGLFKSAIRLSEFGINHPLEVTEGHEKEFLKKTSLVISRFSNTQKMIMNVKNPKTRFLCDSGIICVEIKFSWKSMQTWFSTFKNTQKMFLNVKKPKTKFLSDWGIICVEIIFSWKSMQTWFSTFKNNKAVIRFERYAYNQWDPAFTSCSFTILDILIRHRTRDVTCRSHLRDCGSEENRLGVRIDFFLWWDHILGVHPMPCKVVHFYVRKSPSQSDQ